MTDVVLHHYDTSPYAEKVRLALGYKRIAWRSVIIPNIMPKPDVIALTGGYRKTPVMQIGADIYCDTSLIVRELERRYPQPSLYPTPLAEAFASWAELKTFSPAVSITFAHIGDTLPQEFKEDRAKFSGRDFNTDRLRAALPYVQDQLRGVLSVIDDVLRTDTPFLFGNSPSIADLAAYHPLWFIGKRIGKPVAPLSLFPRVLDWMERIKAIGHGTPTEMSSAEAIALARRSEPASTTLSADGQDPAGRKPGDRVSVTPDDTGKEPTVGEIIGSNAKEMVIRRTNERAGTVHVHFPRLGFVVAPMKSE